MKIRTEVKIGIIVLSTILLVIWGINYLKGKNILKRTDVFYAVFHDISGLKQSGSVFINGLKVGLINTIEFTENNYNEILIAFSVNEGIDIPQNSVVEIYSADLLGNKALRIIPGDAQLLASHGDTLSSSTVPDMISGLMDQLKPFTDNASNALVSLDSLITAFNKIMDPSIQQKLRQSISNLERTSGSLANQLSAEGKLNLTLTNLEAFSKTLSDNKEKLNDIIANLEGISDSVARSNLKSALLNMNQTFNQAQLMLSEINAGKGSLGLFATSDSFYNNLNNASKNLSLLLEDLNENPKRYVHFSIFGKKDTKK